MTLCLSSNILVVKFLTGYKQFLRLWRWFLKIYSTVLTYGCWDSPKSIQGSGNFSRLNNQFRGSHPLSGFQSALSLQQKDDI